MQVITFDIFLLPGHAKLSKTSCFEYGAYLEGLPGKKLDHGLVSVVAASAAKEELQYTPYQNWFSRLVQLKSTRL